jgi:hypothetical protein
LLQITLGDVTFLPSEVAGKHEECMDEPQMKQGLSSQTMLPEQPIKEQNRRSECLLVAYDSSAEEGVVLTDGGVVISNYYYGCCNSIKNQHMSFFLLATTQTDVSLLVKLYPPNQHNSLTKFGISLLILG